jgi:iron(III) transport system substrate-binding protein
LAVDGETAIASVPAALRRCALDRRKGLAAGTPSPGPACPSRRLTILGLGAATLDCFASSVRAQPAEHTGPLPGRGDAAEELIVYSTTDQDEVDGVIAEFESRAPGIRVRYEKQNSDEQYAQVIREAASGRGTADVVWSSAMDLQMKLVNDGYAQTYTPAELSGLPDWAVWKEQAYGVTAEPIVFVYNRDRIRPDEVPQSHAALREFLVHNVDRLRGQVATYDPERSGTGLLFFSQDVGITPLSWDLIAALGRADSKLFTTTSSMLEGVSSGRLLIAYNVIGSYAMARSLHDTALGVVIPSDYAIVMTRIAFVPTAARHPNLGKAFLDLLLSVRGQKLLARQYLGSVRADVSQTSVMAEQMGDGDRAKPIHIGPELLAYQDQARRASFIRQWRHAAQSRS